MSTTPAPDRSPRLHPALRLLPGLRGEVGALHIARSVYGAIIALSLLLVLQSAHGPRGAALALLATLTAIALAEVYADTLAHGVLTHESMTPPQVRELLVSALAVIGAGVPAALVLMVAPVWFEEGSSFTLAAWTTVALLGLFAFGARRLAGAPMGLSLRSGLVAAGIGVAIALLKAVLH
ncbi:MAG TPA: hypothetical protein VLB03_08285 [Nocardioidaceae bacterium]|nr:hypothetical protein [Nocardioidaceae bacterium]